MAFRLSSLDPQQREDPPPTKVEGFELETCAIRRWRGYVCSSFVALTADGTPIAESSDFRWRRATQPANEGAPREAYVALVAALERLGWQRCDGEDVPWFATNFSRFIAVADVPRPSQVPPPPLPEPAAPQAVALVEQVPHAAPPTPATVAGPATPPRRGRLIAAVSVVGAVAALGVGVTIVTHVGGGSAQHVIVVAPGAKATSAKKVDVVAPGATATSTKKVDVVAPGAKAASAKTEHVSPVQATPAVPPRIRLQIVAKNRPSWLELRRGSRTGRVLYSGELAVGGRLRFVAARIWARFGAASNLTITSNGRPVVLIGTFEHVFAAKR